MADFSEIKTEIQTNIKTNGNQEITGAILQDTLIDIVDAIDENITELESEQSEFDGAKLKNIESIIYTRSDNLYNKKEQTSDNISPHYYVAGKPYETSEFDSLFNATAFIPILPGTQYTLGLVPDFNNIVAPWSNASQGVFFYDVNKNYINGTTAISFKTPPRACYLRFNFAIGQGITLNILNNHCVLTYGNELPLEYIEPFSKSIKEEINDVNSTLDNITQVIFKETSVIASPQETLYNIYIASNGNLASLNYMIVECWNVTEGEKFILSAKGGVGSARAYALYSTDDINNIDSTNAVLIGHSISDGDFVDNITIPQGVSVLAITKSYTYTEYEVIKITTETLEERVSTLENLATKTSNLFYRIIEDGIEIYQKYGNQDLAIVMKRKGGNNLFDFYQIGVCDNNESYIKSSLSDYEIIASTGTDWYAPFKVLAQYNADGDNKNSDETFNDYFTGGNHQYNNSGSGSTPTAEAISLSFIIDGKTASMGEEGFASTIIIKWSNLVQGQNTTKADGSGRSILQENHILHINGTKFKSFVELKPLEDIYMVLWYGFQAYYQGLFNSLKFVDSPNRKDNVLPSSVNCGSAKDCSAMILNGNKISLLMCVDTNIDLGKRAYNQDVSAAFAAGYGKVYFGIVSSTLSMSEGDSYYLNGEYDFLV